MLEHLRRRSPASNSLLAIISDVRSRWRIKLLMRGAVGMAGIAFAIFLVAAYGMEWARFSPASILAGRVILLVALIACALWFLVRPLRRQVSDEQVALYLEEHEPSLQATLLSAVEASQQGHPQSAALVHDWPSPLVRAGGGGVLSSSSSPPQPASDAPTHRTRPTIE